MRAHEPHTLRIAGGGRLREPLVVSPCAVRGDEEFSALVTLMAAFALDPVARWAWPNPSHHAEAFPAYARALAGRAFECGTADGTDPMIAAALWLPPGVESDPSAVTAAIRANVPEWRAPGALALYTRLRRARPKEPHWHLALIGVLPGFQGRGLGTALLRRGLARCDQDRVPAYTEATSIASRAMLEQHGFVLARQVHVGDSPPVWAMARSPAPIGRS